MFSMADVREQTDQIVHRLKSLGLTKYEALVYIALLKVTGATATEIHGISGVPRASVYPVLTQLEEKGLVSISQSTPRRFAALPPEDGIGSLLARIESDAEDAQEALIEIHRQSLPAGRMGQELIWNVHGIAAIRKRLIELIGQAQSGIRIMAHCGLFSDEMQQALAKKAEQMPVEIYTHEWKGPVPASMSVKVTSPLLLMCEIHKAKALTAGGVCVIDDRKIFVVIGSGDEDAVALYSESEGFVRFFSRYYTLIRELADKTGQ